MESLEGPYCCNVASTSSLSPTVAAVARISLMAAWQVFFLQGLLWLCLGYTQHTWDKRRSSRPEFRVILWYGGRAWKVMGSTCAD